MRLDKKGNSKELKSMEGREEKPTIYASKKRWCFASFLR